MFALGAGLVQHDESPLTPADGKVLEDSLEEILRNVPVAMDSGSGRDVGDRNPRTVVVTERSITGYLRFQGASLLPPGVHDPIVKMNRNGLVNISANLDLDQLRKQQTSQALGLLRYLGGTVRMNATGVVRSAVGTILFDVESVEVGSIRVPQTVLFSLIEHYTRSEQYPDGIDLSNEFRLPPGIESVQVEDRHTVVVQ